MLNKEGKITSKENALYEAEKVTPQQKALLANPNCLPYQSIEELQCKDTVNPEISKEDSGKTLKLGNPSNIALSA